MIPTRGLRRLVVVSITLSAALESWLASPALASSFTIAEIAPSPARAGVDTIVFRTAPGAPSAGTVLVWESDVDGVLSRSADASFQMRALDLTVGDHKITLSTETPADGKTLCDTTTLVVLPAPMVRVLATATRRRTVHMSADESRERRELHRFSLEHAGDEELRIDELVYRRSPGTTMSGLRKIRIYADLNEDGQADNEEELAQVPVRGKVIRFEDVEATLPPGMIELILEANITHDTLKGFDQPLLPFLLLAVAATWSLRRKRGAWLTLVMATAMLAVASFDVGCNDSDNSTVQVTIQSESDLQLSLAESSTPVEVEDFPADGLLGNRYRVKDD